MRFDPRRFGLFNLVASGGFLIQMTMLTLLTRVSGWHYLPAALVAIELAILQNFVGHSWLTWRDRLPIGWRAWTLRFGRYQFAKNVLVLANLAVTAALVKATGWPPELATICAVAVCSIFSFLVSDRIVFTSAHGRPLTVESDGQLSPADC